MKTQLIMLDIPIIVSDEEIKANEWFYSPKLKTKQIFGKSEIPKDRGFLKIIAGIEGLPSINWNGLEEEFGYIDVDKLAKELDKTKYRNFRREYTLKETYEGIEDGFIEGFKKAQYLNDKKFSLDDMKEAYHQGWYDKAENKVDNRDKFIQSLQQPKVFDIGIDKEEYDHDEDWSEISGAFEICKYRPKITNNSIKILRKL